MAVKEELFVFCGCYFRNVCISDRFEESLHYSYILSQVWSCECGTCTGLCLDLVSSPQSLGPVLISIHSGLGHGLVSVHVVLTTSQELILRVC